MKTTTRGAAILLLFLSGMPAWAGSHTWDVNEVFSTADGSVWFVELREANGTPNEIGVGGHMVTSNASGFIIASNVASPTSNKHLLFANQAFADLFANLPGAPVPDQIVAIDNFININGDTISYIAWDSFTFGAGQLPTDGINSLSRSFATGANSPTNYAGGTGSVDASGSAPPPGIPDGTSGSTPMTVSRLNAAATRLEIAWDSSTCSPAADDNIIFGQGGELPGSPGGPYALSGGVCGIGSTGLFIWDPVPSATDGSGLLWWLVVTGDGSGVEGPWGKYDGVNERVGPGPGGASLQCGATAKDLSSTCGH